MHIQKHKKNIQCNCCFYFLAGVYQIGMDLPSLWLLSAIVPFVTSSFSETLGLWFPHKLLLSGHKSNVHTHICVRACVLASLSQIYIKYVQ